MKSDAELITILRARRDAAGISDTELASRLGISQPLWSRVQSGKRRVTRRVLEGAMAAFPDLTADVLFLMRRN